MRMVTSESPSPSQAALAHGARGYVLKDVDFAQAVARAPENVRDYRQAVMRCVACGHEGECTAWMDTHPQAAEAPDYCRNKDILESLAKA